MSTRNRAPAGEPGSMSGPRGNRATPTLWGPSWRSLSSEVIPGFEGSAFKGPWEP